MTFANIEYLFFLLLLIPLIAFYVFREKKKKESLLFSEIKGLQKLPKQLSVRLRHILIVLRVAGLALLIVALARPQTGAKQRLITSDGIDIVMVLDVSTSMKALDFKPENRLAVAKREIKNFIDKREADRIGLVLFAGQTFIKCPLTMDYSMLKSMVDEVDFSIIKQANNTAIGTAISTASLRLNDSKAKSRVMILLTDGDNNKGVAPELPAKEAAKLGLKIYTIGVGKKGLIDYPYEVRSFGGTKTVIRQIESDLNEESLTKIATLTGGEYFRAENSKELATIYETIDRLEKTEIEAREWIEYEEHFYIFLLIGFILLLLDFILANTRFRRIP